MREVDPAVVRVLDVPAGVTLPELHDLLQVATSWTDSHLHQFVAGAVRYAAPDIDDFNEFEDERAETGVQLRALPARSHTGTTSATTGTTTSRPVAKAWTLSAAREHR